MTEERKNEIWALLPRDYKEWLKAQYRRGVSAGDFRYERSERAMFEKFSEAVGGLNMLEFLFGKDNLTAKAEGRLLFKSNYKVGDKVVIVGSLCESKGEIITLLRHYDCPREANGYQKLWVGQFDDGHTCSIAEKDFTQTVEFEEAEGKSDETTPKSPSEPKFKVGDNVIFRGKTKVVKEVRHGINNTTTYVVTTLLGLTPLWVEESEIKPYTEPKEESNLQQNVVLTNESEKNGKTNTENEPKSPIHTGNVNSSKNNSLETANSVKTSVDYAKYRLELAKEIAVAMVGNLRLSTMVSRTTIAEDAVDIADKIIARLKETEECDV